jgi:hypothetical protein
MLCAAPLSCYADGCCCMLLRCWPAAGAQLCARTMMPPQPALTLLRAALSIQGTKQLWASRGY